MKCVESTLISPVIEGAWTDSSMSLVKSSIREYDLLHRAHLRRNARPVGPFFNGYSSIKDGTARNARSTHDSNMVSEMPYCYRCGKEIEANARFCWNCGAQLKPLMAPPPSPPHALRVPRIAVRPSAVTILAVLYWLSAIVAILGGLACVVGIAYLLPLAFPALFWIVGAVLIVIGILDIVIGWGLWTLKKWARTFAIVLAIIGLISFPIGTVISIVTLRYLFKPEIKAYFA